MKIMAPLVLFVVFTVFAQQQNKTPAPKSVAPAPVAAPTPIPQEIIPEPEVPLVPALPIPEEIIQTAPPQPPQPVLLPIDPKDTLPLPPLPPLPPSPLPEDTLSTPVTDSASVAPVAPAPLPQDTTPQQAVPPKADSASIVPTPIAPAPKDTTPPKPSLPMNTITVDLGPTIIGVAAEETFKIFGKSKLKGVEISAFGIGVQYEFQPIRFLSLPLKFAYMGFTTKAEEEKTFKKTFPADLKNSIDRVRDSLENIRDELQNNQIPVPDSLNNMIEQLNDFGTAEIPVDSKLEAELSIWSIEAHPRLYPFGGSFFLEGMVGYANLTTKFKGNANASIRIGNIDIPDDILSNLPNIPTDTVYNIDVDHKASRNYLKYGGKLGWRVDFGKPGGLIFEYAIGWYFAKGLGNKTIIKQLTDYVEGEVNSILEKDEDSKYKGFKPEPDTKKIDDAFSLLEQFGLVGGPRCTFAFGWRF